MGKAGKELNYWLLSFSKGRTDCIGKKYVDNAPQIEYVVKKLIGA